MNYVTTSNRKKTDGFNKSRYYLWKNLGKNLNIMEPSSKLLHGLEETTRHGENSSVVRDDLTV